MTAAGWIAIITHRLIDAGTEEKFTIIILSRRTFHPDIPTNNTVSTPDFRCLR